MVVGFGIPERSTFDINCFRLLKGELAWTKMLPNKQGSLWLWGSSFFLKHTENGGWIACQNLKRPESWNCPSSTKCKKLKIKMWCSTHDARTPAGGCTWFMSSVKFHFLSVFTKLENFLLYIHHFILTFLFRLNSWCWAVLHKAWTNMGKRRTIFPAQKSATRWIWMVQFHAPALLPPEKETLVPNE
jgi:hypothetical protein